MFSDESGSSDGERTARRRFTESRTEELQNRLDWNPRLAHARLERMQENFVASVNAMAREMVPSQDFRFTLEQAEALVAAMSAGPDYFEMFTIFMAGRVTGPGPGHGPGLGHGGERLVGDPGHGPGPGEDQDDELGHGPGHDDEDSEEETLMNLRLIFGD